LAASTDRTSAGGGERGERERERELGKRERGRRKKAIVRL
jgi:hypothetical protein